MYVVARCCSIIVKRMGKAERDELCVRARQKRLNIRLSRSSTYHGEVTRYDHASLPLRSQIDLGLQVENVYHLPRTKLASKWLVD